MDRNTILLSLGGSDDYANTDLTEALCRRITVNIDPSRGHGQKPVAVNNLYLTVLGMEIEKPMPKHKLQDNGWMKIDTACDFSLKIIPRRLPQESLDATIDICEELHNVCSHIPVIGTAVDVFCLCDDTMPAVGDSLELFGALRCLVSWYNACVTFIQPGNSDKVSLWAEVLEARTLTQAEFIGEQFSPPFWRGYIEIIGSQSNYLQLCGFTLDSHPSNTKTQVPNITFNGEPNIELELTSLSGKVLSPKMEYLGELDIGHVPPYYLSGITYQLKLISSNSVLQQSQRFLDRMKENRWLGCVMRIGYGTGWKEVDCDNHYLDPTKRDKKKSWKDYIGEDPSYAQGHPVETEMLGGKGYHTFVVYYDPVHQTHTAHLLRQPDQINGAVMHDITMMEINTFSTDECKESTEREDSISAKMHELVTGLPHLPHDTLMVIHRKIEELQTLVLQEWIEKKNTEGSPVISEADLYTIFNETRDTCMNVLLQKFSSTYQPVEIMERKEVTPEWELDPYSRPERVVLANQHTQKSKMSRFKSTDSLGGLSPPSKNQVVMLDAAEFLKFFKADGTAAKENLSKLSIKKEVKNSVTCCADEARCASWPECARHKYHGIQYHGQAIVDEVEQKCIKLKSRLNCVDTSSTCTLEQAHSPASLSVTMAPELPPDRDTQNVHKAEVEISQSHPKPRKSTRNAELQIEQDSKRLYNAKKRKLDAQLKEKEKSDLESRSQRHKRRLQEVVHGTLVENGIKKDNPIYKACIQRLYTLSKSLVKDLKSSHNLKEQMEKIARINAPMVIMFEKSVLQTKVP